MIDLARVATDPPQADPLLLDGPVLVDGPVLLDGSVRRLGSPPSGRRPRLASAEDARATELMARFRDSRSREDFEALYAATWSSVHAWVRSLLRHDVRSLDASELTQDTFVNVFRYPTGFRDECPSSYRVWVRTIAGNVVRRARGRLPRETSLEPAEGSPEPISREAGPEDRADLSEAADRLGRAHQVLLVAYARAYSELAPRDRRALELVEVEGLGYADAAEVLGVRAPNMKMIVFRARQRLHRRLTEFFSSALGVAA